MLSSLRRFQESEVAQQRLKIIQFYDKHGEAATKEAFGADRKVIWQWKRQLERAHGELAALIPHSTRPKHTRQMETEPRILAFIQQLREAHPRLGKEKIKPLLDEYCQREGLEPIAVSTIGKIIHRKQLFQQPSPRGAKKSRKSGIPRDRVRYAPKPGELGHLQLDTVERVMDGLKLYFYSGIDVKGKFAFSLPYRRRDSAATVDFFDKLRQVYPLPVIASVQNDNGSEFLGEFERYLQQQGIRQLFTYPRCPKINGCVERYQRTLSEEFIEVHEDLVRTPAVFQRQLADYLIFYNCQRAHSALQMLSPMQHLLAQGVMSKKSVTHTPPCQNLHK
jgi:transposase InsO family protein